MYSSRSVPVHFLEFRVPKQLLVLFFFRTWHKLLNRLSKQESSYCRYKKKCTDSYSIRLNLELNKGCTSRSTTVFTSIGFWFELWVSSIWPQQPCSYMLLCFSDKKSYNFIIIFWAFACKIYWHQKIVAKKRKSQHMTPKSNRMWNRKYSIYIKKRKKQYKIS